jgi:sensor histidine kinase YesM
VVIRVSDNGVGIPADILPGLLSTKQEGAGVGLRNINRRLLSCFGKSLSITSQFGEGTMVTMTIPLNCSEIVQNHLA